MRTLLYRASAQISIVSARGDISKRLETSKEQRKTEECERPELRKGVSTKVKESADAIGRVKGKHGIKNRCEPFGQLMLG